MPLSTEKLAAWKRHPDTFFGIVGQRSTYANSALAFYDFFHESLRRKSKERLLEVMANAPDSNSSATSTSRNLQASMRSADECGAGR